MDNEWQTIFNWLGGIVISGLGWFAKSTWARQQAQSERISALEVLVAGKYVTREDFQRTTTEMFTLLHRIEDKLDRKADKE